MLAKIYGMNVIVYDTNTHKKYTIDFKSSNIILPANIRHNIFYGLIDTKDYFEDREQDK